MFQAYRICPYCERRSEQGLVSQYMTKSNGDPAYLKTKWHCQRCLKSNIEAVVLIKELESIILSGVGGSHEFK